MDVVQCPHCQAKRSVASRVPRDVVVVMPCPDCKELAVLFRNLVIPLSRQILENGSRDERRRHLADVIAEFLESGLFPLRAEFNTGDFGDDQDNPFDADDTLELGDDENPILQEEVDKFTRIDLKCLDNAAYFRRHFGAE